MQNIAPFIFMLLLAASALPAAAQQAPDQNPAPHTVQPATLSDPAPDLFAQGTLDGQAAAEDKGTAGWAVGGFVSGVGLGLIGTGVTYALAAGSKPKPPANKLAAIQSPDANYRLAYQNAYESGVKRKRKRSALVGGLVGTATFVAVILATGAEHD